MCIPLQESDDLNLYGYTQNDPLNHTDPTGDGLCVPYSTGIRRCYWDNGWDHFKLALHLWASGLAPIAMSEGKRDDDGKSSSDDASKSDQVDEDKTFTTPEEASVPEEIIDKIPASCGNGQPNSKKQGWRWRDPDDKAMACAGTRVTLGQGGGPSARITSAWTGVAR